MTAEAPGGTGRSCRAPTCSPARASEAGLVTGPIGILQGFFMDIGTWGSLTPGHATHPGVLDARSEDKAVNRLAEATS